MATVDLEPCPGCGTRFPGYEGPVHRYIGASAACWALYGALLADGEPEPVLLHGSAVAPADAGKPPGPALPPGLDGLLVDAYAAANAAWARARALRRRGVFSKLTPPPLGAALSIRHLFPGGGVTTPCGRAEYVASVLASWESLHAATLGQWYEQYVIAD